MPELLSLDESLALSPQRTSELFEAHVNRYLLQIFRALGMDRLDFERAQGAEIWLKDGRRLLDFSGGIGVVGVGHNHPRILAAERRCHEELVVDSIRIAPHKLQAALAHNISQMLPDPLNVCYFAVSGSEAVESAMKLCERAQRPKKKFICITDSFHGKTHGALSVTTAHNFQDGFVLGVPSENVIAVPFGDVDAIEKAITETSVEGRPNDVIAVIVESISGESARVPPDGYLTAVAETCRRHEVLTIYDEVKVGMGRTGAFCAFQHEEVVPDVVTIAKALGGSKRAIGAMVTSQRLFDRAYGERKNATLHSCSFGGLGESCAVAIETLNILQDENLISRAAEIGGYFGSRLQWLHDKYPQKIREVLGRGLFRALRLDFRQELTQKLTGKTKTGLTSTLQSVFMAATIRQLFERHGVLVHFQPGAPDIMHFMPALVVERNQVDAVIDALDDVLGRGVSESTFHFVRKNAMQFLSRS